jgi:phosphatidylglycerophosphate synthase
MNRRELRTRGRAWPHAVANGLARAGFTPNQVSVLSVAFAIGAAAAYHQASRAMAGPIWMWLVVAAACIQLRLLCNLLDGLLAIEGGLKSKTGDLYNEVPDRLGDIAIMLGVGLVLRPFPHGLTVAWGMVVVALLTAYVRLLGGSLGLVQDFTGPMAKQHRMFTITLASLVAAGEYGARGTMWALYVAAWIVTVGAAFTFVRRLARIARQLEAR